ncbi:MAG TPA: hypothetical protein VGO50_16490 [Pyrinomonadaceae bacterium]|jgi:hypothetical protein|nr:hypothetical protein [Pyrinomonadaceae bacterium]
MRKILFKLTFLAVALVSVSYISNKDVAARTKTTCIDNASAYYAHFVTCDGEFDQVVQDQMNAPTDCAAEANSACTSSANQPCWNNSYNACANTRTTNFNNKSFIYASCINSDEICQYEIQDFCSTAFSQAVTCSALYYTTGNYDEYSACYWASKYWTCF